MQKCSDPMTGDFFQRQDAARKRTVWLLVLMFGAVMLASLLLAVVLQTFLLQSTDGYSVATDARAGLLQPKVFGMTLLGVSAVVLVAWLWKSIQLARGGSTVAEMVGGRLVAGHTTHPGEKMLINVVEEMAIASGVPMPQVYVLNESSINAFAAGHTINDAAIGVTRGALKLLTRDELQGVIAHEFSHILNGDMRLNTRLIAMVFGLLVFTILGRVVMRVSVQAGSYGRRSSKGNAALYLIVVGFLVMMAGYVGVFFCNLIKSAISRQREYLADASAVQFTRNPDGIAGALIKIGTSGSRISHAEAEELSHMFFGEGVTAGLTNWFSSHPPLLKRIRAVKPEFDGDFRAAAEALRAKQSALLEEMRAEWLTGGEKPPPIPGAGKGLATEAMLMNAMAAPSSHHLTQARRFYHQVPESVRKALHEAPGAQAVVAGLVMAHDPASREKQMTLLRQQAPLVAAEYQKLADPIAAIPVGQRIPVVELAIPALRLMNDTQLEAFDRLIRDLTSADEEIDFFEFALAHLLRRHLHLARRPRAIPKRSVRDAATLRADKGLLLSALAHLCAMGGGTTAEAAFMGGVRNLNDRGTYALRPWDACHLAAIDTALDRLAEATPNIRKNFLYACGVTVTSNRRVTASEAELVRAIADALDCPMPPTVTFEG